MRARQLAGLAGLPALRARRARRAAGPPRIRFVYRDLGAPTRYRVGHQIEQARLAGLAVEDAPASDPAHLYDLASCDLLYLYRLPLTSYTLPLCLAARWLRIPIVFDSDDLVWDARERSFNYLDQHYPPSEVARILRENQRLGALMRRADAFVLATPFLAEQARQHFAQPAYVHPNAVAAEMQAWAQIAAVPRPPDAPVVAYFAGTPRVHEEDLASIGPALAAALDSFPEARLRVYGELRLAAPLHALAAAGRLEQRPLVGWAALPAEIAQADISIAPLVDNPQRRAKSAVKYYEAALLGVPTVAQRLEPYASDIANGRTGLLAGSASEWRGALQRLLGDATLRRQLGAAARADVLAHHTTAVRAPAFAAIIEQVLGRVLR